MGIIKVPPKQRVAISFTHRVEELNVLLEILKLNFKKKYEVFVFCNLADEGWAEIEPHLQKNLIDHLVRLPDEKCVRSNKNKQDCKRRQPLEMFIKIMEYMNEYHPAPCMPFIYTEGDVFPLDEEAYLAPLEDVGFMQLHVRTHDVRSPKTPAGYVSPSPMYIDDAAGAKLAFELNAGKQLFLSGNIAFEGMLGLAASRMTAGKMSLVTTFSKHFRSNHVIDQNLEPVSQTTHQHNPFNVRKCLEERGMTQGTWITKCLNEDRIVRAWDGEILQYDPTFNLTTM